MVGNTLKIELGKIVYALDDFKRDYLNDGSPKDKEILEDTLFEISKSTAKILGKMADEITEMMEQIKKNEEEIRRLQGAQ